MNQADGQQFTDDQDNNSGETQPETQDTETEMVEEVEEKGESNDDLPEMSELQMLKERAKIMGISHSGNIGVEALRAKINQKLTADNERAEEQEAAVEEHKIAQAAARAEKAQEQLNPLEGDVAGKTPTRKLTTRERVRRDALKLVRVRITNMDPKKKDLAGEILAVGNKYTGVIRKFVPYGEVTDDGYHIPQILYDELNDRRFLNIRVSKDRRTGQTKTDTSWAKEFALEVLPQLTPDELAKLAAAQAAAGSID
jgi:hypothetical protein